MYDKDLLYKVGNAMERRYCSSLINSHCACDTIQEQMRFLFTKNAFHLFSQVTAKAITYFLKGMHILYMAINPK